MRDARYTEGGRSGHLSTATWGVEQDTVAMRHYKAMMAGVDPVRRQQRQAAGSRCLCHWRKEHGKVFYESAVPDIGRASAAVSSSSGLFESVS